jgi:hypothetical protein
MFGYINVNRKELKQKDEADYQAFYCGLCRQLKAEAGIRGQMLLNYDMTFLVILLTGLYELDTRRESHRCAIHPASRKTVYRNAATEYAAAMDVVLSYHNLQDDYRDEGSKIKHAMAESLKKDYKRICLQYPRQVKAVENYMIKLAAAERRKETNIDIVAGYTGDMLGEIFLWKQDEWSKDLKSMGFYMGKFIYLLDAYEDMKQDQRRGCYNPLAAISYESVKEYETFCRSTLTSLMAECARSFERMPILLYSEILRNVLYSGVWTRYEYLKLKQKRQKKETEEIR